MFALQNKIKMLNTKKLLIGTTTLTLIDVQLKTIVYNDIHSA
jgi:hypothetical protein